MPIFYRPECSSVWSLNVGYFLKVFLRNRTNLDLSDYLLNSRQDLMFHSSVNVIVLVFF